MRALFRLLAAHRDYRLLVSAGLISMTGDWVMHVGLAFLVYHITGSTLASGTMLLASFLPTILLGSVAGVLVDRWDRRTTMIVANLLQVVGLVPLLGVHGTGTIWIVYLVAGWEGCVEQFFSPAEQAIIPNLVPREELLGANGVNSQVRDLARLVGSFVGGVVAALAGIAGLAICDMASFAIAAGLLMSIRWRATPTAAEAGEPGPAVGGLSRALAEWRAGLRTAMGSRALRVILLFGLVTAMGEGIMGTLFAPFVQDVLHGGGGDYGLIVGIQAVGGIIGGVCVTSAGHRWSAYALFGWGAVAFGIVDLCLFLYPLVLSGVVPALVCMVIVGIPGACTVAGFMTTFQTVTTDEYRGRVYGAMNAVEGGAVLIGIAIASSLGETVGIVPIISIQGAGYVAGGALVLVALRHSRATSAHVDDPAEPTLVAQPAAG
jgi:Na+/melibiose symporter-like transporter